METLAKSDIFFFVTTVCVVIITSLLAVILFDVLHIVRKTKKTVDRIHCEADGLADDFADIRASLRKNQYGLKPIMDAINGKKKKRAQKKKVVDENNF